MNKLIDDDIYEYIKDLVAEPISKVYLYNNNDDEMYESIINRLLDTNDEIGNASIYDYELKHNRVLAIGNVHYYIYKEYRNKGYAYEAISLVL